MREQAEARVAELEAQLEARVADAQRAAEQQLVSQRSAHESTATELASLREQLAASQAEAASARAAVEEELQQQRAKVAALDRQKAETEVRALQRGPASAVAGACVCGRGGSASRRAYLPAYCMPRRPRRTPRWKTS